MIFKRRYFLRLPILANSISETVLLRTAFCALNLNQDVISAAPTEQPLFRKAIPVTADPTNGQTEIPSVHAEEEKTCKKPAPASNSNDPVLVPATELPPNVNIGSPNGVPTLTNEEGETIASGDKQSTACSM